ncbi:MAG: lipid-binding SYLF domain-containing protein [Planctomycetota bacterium]
MLNRQTRLALRCAPLALALAFALGTLLAAPAARAQAREEARVIIATQVMEDLRKQRDQYIPDLLLERAYGIAIVPEVKKGAFGLGVRGGKGVLLVRDKQGRFSNPVFLTLAGGSFGWQVGVQSTDLVLVFTTRSGVEGIADGKLTLGGDASVAAGPVGRSASAATDANFSGAEIYSYSRSSGIFAGVALDGTALSIDKSANAHFYGQRKVAASDIMNGAVVRDIEPVRRLLAAVATGTRRGAGVAPAGAAGETAPAPAAAPAAAPASPATAPAAEAKTFPMEDGQPGREPPR